MDKNESLNFLNDNIFVEENLNNNNLTNITKDDLVEEKTIYSNPTVNEQPLPFIATADPTFSSSVVTEQPLLASVDYEATSSATIEPHMPVFSTTVDNQNPLNYNVNGAFSPFTDINKPISFPFDKFFPSYIDTNKFGQPSFVNELILSPFNTTLNNQTSLYSIDNEASSSTNKRISLYSPSTEKTLLPSASSSSSVIDGQTTIPNNIPSVFNADGPVQSSDAKKPIPSFFTDTGQPSLSYSYDKQTSSFSITNGPISFSFPCNQSPFLLSSTTNKPTSSAVNTSTFMNFSNTESHRNTKSRRTTKNQHTSKKKRQKTEKQSNKPIINDTVSEAKNNSIKVYVVPINFQNKNEYPIYYNEKAKSDDYIELNVDTDTLNQLLANQFIEEPKNCSNEGTLDPHKYIKVKTPEGETKFYRKIKIETYPQKKYTRDCKILKKEKSYYNYNDNDYDNINGKNSDFKNVILANNVFKEIEIKELKDIEKKFLSILFEGYRNNYKYNNISFFEIFKNIISNIVTKEINDLTSEEKQKVKCLEHLWIFIFISHNYSVDIKYIKNILDNNDEISNLTDLFITNYINTFINNINNNKGKMSEDYMTDILNLKKYFSNKKTDGEKVINQCLNYIVCYNCERIENLEDMLTKVKMEIIKDNRRKEINKRISKCVEYLWDTIVLKQERIDNIESVTNLRNLLTDFQKGNVVENHIVIFENNTKRNSTDEIKILNEEVSEEEQRIKNKDEPSSSSSSDFKND